MALTLKQKAVLNRHIGVLEGISWVACIDEKMRPIAEAINTVCSELEMLLDDDGGAGDE
ncbi:MAG: hypothetical protein IKK34_07005 [Clostridia bacterium]|nr:hypothetical protein [Clostridia bacterium]